MEERKQELGNYGYAADMRAVSDDGSLDLLSLEYLVDTGACVLGTPDQCVDACKRYEAAGVDLLLCLVNPYKIGHEQVMQTIDLMGKHVIPQFSSRARRTRRFLINATRRVPARNHIKRPRSWRPACASRAAGARSARATSVRSRPPGPTRRSVSRHVGSLQSSPSCGSQAARPSTPKSSTTCAPASAASATISSG